MRNGLYLAITPLPSDDLGALRAALDAVFPGTGNAAYLDVVSAVGRPHVPTRVSAARLGALSLLPRLIELAGGSPAGLMLCRDRHGRPYAVNGDGVRPFDFNLSHSDAHVACALLVGGGRVGLDVEEPIPPERAKPLVQRYATLGERALINNDPLGPSGGFTRLWTMREAIGKYIGGGEPLRYDAAHPPDGVCLRSARLPDTGGYLTVCLSSDEGAVPTIRPESVSVIWERGCCICNIPRGKSRV